jgi:anti-anti-sigma factor
MRGDGQDSAVEVMVTGELDMAAAFKLETEVDALLAAPHVQAVALDLGEVEFIDSAGLGALLAIRDRAQELGVELAIPRISERVRHILDVTGLGGLAES